MVTYKSHIVTYGACFFSQIGGAIWVFTLGCVIYLFRSLALAIRAVCSDTKLNLGGCISVSL